MISNSNDANIEVRRYIAAIKALMQDEMGKSPRMDSQHLRQEYSMYNTILNSAERSAQKLDKLIFLANRNDHARGKLHELISNIDLNIPYAQSDLKKYMDANKLTIETPPASPGQSPTASPRVKTEKSIIPEPTSTPQQREKIASDLLKAIDKFIDFELSKPVTKYTDKLKEELSGYKKILSMYNADGEADKLTIIQKMAANNMGKATVLHEVIRNINMKQEIVDPRITLKVLENLSTPKSLERQADEGTSLKSGKSR